MEGKTHLGPRDEPSMAELFREAEDRSHPRPGDLRRGVIVACSPQGIAVDLHIAQAGFIPPEDLEKLPQEERVSLREGQEVLVYVTDAEDTEGKVLLSLYLARREQDWLAAEELQRQDRFWIGHVTGYNKGGLIVPFGHIRGFVPISQISDFPRNLPAGEKLARLAALTGRQMAFKVLEVDRRQHRLVLSERLGRLAQQEAQQRELLANLRKGEVRRGRVRSLTDYGAFVDLGGVTGLIHRTELAWFRVEHPIEIVQEGQEVDVYVLRVSRDRLRISLSLKRTYPDPWPTVQERYQLDQMVEGRVIRRTGAGAFLLLDDGVLGFIPAADLEQSGRAEEVEVGQRLQARLVRIDGMRRRLGLSLRTGRARGGKGRSGRPEV